MKKLLTTIALTAALAGKIIAQPSILNGVDIFSTNNVIQTTFGVINLSGFITIPGIITNAAFTITNASYFGVRTNVNYGADIRTDFDALNTFQTNAQNAFNTLYSAPQFGGQVVAPSLALTNQYTPASDHDTTFAWPIGTLASDSNYIYRVVWTNAWGRVAWTTNGW